MLVPQKFISATAQDFQAGRGMLVSVSLCCSWKVQINEHDDKYIDTPAELRTMSVGLVCPRYPGPHIREFCTLSMRRGYTCQTVVSLESALLSTEQ
jgi:hypothetical protein